MIFFKRKSFKNHNRIKLSMLLPSESSRLALIATQKKLDKIKARKKTTIVSIFRNKLFVEQIFRYSSR